MADDSDTDTRAGGPAYGAVTRFRLDDRVSVVTGASRGIGRSLAEALAGAGSDLVLCARNAGPLESAAAAIAERTGRRVLAMAGDVAAPGLAERLAATAVGELGRLDVLVNNAGINRRSESVTYSEEDWSAVVGVNLEGAFAVARECGRAMIESGAGGSIVNILSLASRIGLPAAPAYAAAKGGLLQLTRTLAVEWAAHRIRVNGIGPGFIRTELNRALRESRTNDWILRRTPMRRWGETDELAGATLFLASDASSFVTGQVVWVDGGFLAGSDWLSGD